MTNGAAKIKMINASLRCFTFGLLSLLPFIGIPFGVLALVESGKVRVAEKQLWNPARPYMMIGGTIAGLSVIFWFMTGILIIFRLMNLTPD
ncbi:MAG: hypothetical protein ACLQSR_00495 [Limisphaerales bacterium]